jgi:cytochrome c oxidase assembly protein subunit 15
MVDTARTLDYAPLQRVGARYDRLLFWYAFCWCALTLINLTAGGMVTSTGAGLSVPDWPTSYGHNMYALPWKLWVGGIFYEHSHRIIASLVGFMTIGMLTLLILRESRRWMRGLGVAALAAVCVQGLLGGLTVRYFLPTPISVSHAGLAQLYFCLAVSMTVFLSRGWIERDASRPVARAAGLRRLSIALCFVIYGQILLGAIMRHTESGLAITDFPLSHGHLVPPFDAESIEQINHQRRFSDYMLPDITAGQVLSHYVHRVGAVFVTGVILLVGVLVLRRCRGHGWLTRPVWLMFLLLPIQITLGAVTVLSLRAEIPNTAHVVVGASILATSVVLMLRVRRASDVTIEMRETSFAGAEVQPA